MVEGVEERDDGDGLCQQSTFTCAVLRGAKSATTIRAADGLSAREPGDAYRDGHPGPLRWYPGAERTAGDL